LFSSGFFPNKDPPKAGVFVSAVSLGWSDGFDIANKDLDSSVFWPNIFGFGAFGSEGYPNIGFEPSAGLAPKSPPVDGAEAPNNPPDVPDDFPKIDPDGAPNNPVVGFLS